MNKMDFVEIANGAYGDRRELGNRGYSTGDGWRYRGRGLKQLTGLYNYEVFSEWHKKHQHRWPDDGADFVSDPDALLGMKYATRSAVSFWLDKKIYEVADRGANSDVVNRITDLVNKGTGSRAARIGHFERVWGGRILF